MSLGNETKAVVDVPHEIAGLIDYAKALDNRLRASNERLGQTKDRILGTAPEAVSGANETPPANGETEHLRNTLRFIEQALDTLDDLAGAFERL